MTQRTQTVRSCKTCPLKNKKAQCAFLGKAPAAKGARPDCPLAKPRAHIELDATTLDGVRVTVRLRLAQGVA